MTSQSKNLDMLLLPEFMGYCPKNSCPNGLALLVHKHHSILIKLDLTSITPSPFAWSHAQPHHTLRFLYSLFHSDVPPSLMLFWCHLTLPLSSLSMLECTSLSYQPPSEPFSSVWTCVAVAAKAKHFFFISRSVTNPCLASLHY